MFQGGQEACLQLPDFGQRLGPGLRWKFQHFAGEGDQGQLRVRVLMRKSRRIEKAIRLEDVLHGSVEPLQPLRRRHLFDKLAQKVLVAGGGALVIVFVIEPLALQQDFLGLRI